ncbi:hypothetical protein EYF80_027822 [Liparis tanakae]|uniref:Uncharacterized protein n=1 Tax=Liparis tanakae TaxID=230148 RepID=A0A4Z2H7U0_9TELE|nr:hypothetical protein EYF80_027822 [Liparis tanakae]
MLTLSQRYSPNFTPRTTCWYTRLVATWSSAGSCQGLKISFLKNSLQGAFLSWAPCSLAYCSHWETASMTCVSSVLVRPSPVYESTHSLLDEDDLVRYARVPLDLQLHVVVVLMRDE